ncbi:MAG: GNAT family N-acetyltransferase [Solirubrobacteraceae bacterium]
MIAVDAMRPGERRAVARLYADAFMTDPGWMAVGPDRPRMLHAFIRRVCGGEAWAGPRLGAQVRVTRDGGLPSAAMITFGPDAKSTSPLLTVAGSPAAILAGPAAGLRALKADSQLNEHPDEPHVFVSLLAADPRHQRGGRGRALLTRAIEEAEALEVPCHLTTANPDNLPYYRSFGFHVTGEVLMPRNASLWSLLRPS